MTVAAPPETEIRIGPDLAGHPCDANLFLIHTETAITGEAVDRALSPMRNSTSVTHTEKGANVIARAESYTELKQICDTLLQFGKGR